MGAIVDTDNGQVMMMRMLMLLTVIQDEAIVFVNVCNVAVTLSTSLSPLYRPPTS